VQKAWTEQEEEVLISHVEVNGCTWGSIIANLASLAARLCRTPRAVHERFKQLKRDGRIPGTCAYGGKRDEGEEEEEEEEGAWRGEEWERLIDNVARRVNPRGARAGRLGRGGARINDQIRALKIIGVSGQPLRCRAKYGRKATGKTGGFRGPCQKWSAEEDARLTEWVCKAGGPGGWKILAGQTGWEIPSMRTRFYRLQKLGAFSHIQNPDGSWKWRREAAGSRPHRPFSAEEGAAIVEHMRTADEGVSWRQFGKSLGRSRESVMDRSRRLMGTEADGAMLQDRARIREERAARGELPLPPDSASESEEEGESEEETEEGE
jgi:hypothetical protein